VARRATVTLALDGSFRAILFAALGKTLHHRSSFYSYTKVSGSAIIIQRMTSAVLSTLTRAEDGSQVSPANANIQYQFSQLF
jgi:hypothetical protein